MRARALSEALLDKALVKASLEIESVVAVEHRTMILLDKEALSQVFAVNMLREPDNHQRQTIGFLSRGARRAVLRISRCNSLVSLLTRYPSSQATAVGRLFEDMTLQVIQRNARDLRMNPTGSWFQRAFKSAAPLVCGRGPLRGKVLQRTVD